MAALLGATFTPEQEAACDDLIVALEAHLDRVLRYRWLVPDGTVTHGGPLYGPTVVLPVAPIGTVSSVAVSDPWVGATATELADGVGYAVTDAPNGVLRVEAGPWWPEPGRVAVVYALPVNEPVPADVALACTQTVAAWLAPTLPAGALSGGASASAAAASGIKRYSVGQELTVEFADAASTDAGGAAGGGAPPPLPATAVALLAPYGYPPTDGLRFA